MPRKKLTAKEYVDVATGIVIDIIGERGDDPGDDDWDYGYYGDDYGYYGDDYDEYDENWEEGEEEDEAEFEKDLVIDPEEEVIEVPRTAEQDRGSHVVAVRPSDARERYLRQHCGEQPEHGGPFPVRWAHVG